MLAWAYLQQEHYDDAAREAQRSINAFSGWSVPWATLAIAQSGLGQMTAAREALDTCRRLDDRGTREGYEKFFSYVVRDEVARQSISGWLQELWGEVQES